MRISDLLPPKGPTEAEAKAPFEAFLARNGWTFFPEAHLAGEDGKRLRLDYIVRTDIGLSGLEYIGVEAKGSHDGCKEASDAIRQCVSYQHARVADPRLAGTPVAGKRLPFVFLLSHDTLKFGAKPDWREDRYWYGAIRVAAALNIGTVRHDRYDGFGLYAVDQLWSENRGVRKLAEIVAPYVKAGS